MKKIFVLIWILILIPPAMSQSPGDNCQDPIPIIIDNATPFPIVLEDYTCGRGNNAENTCLDMYDGGEDIFYEIQIDYALMLDFYLDPQGSSWFGMALGSSCPLPGETLDDCLAAVTGNSATPQIMQAYLEPGVYYLMIDTWPPPNCLPSFRLEIYPLIFDPFFTCEMPYWVSLPNEAPFIGSNHFTCGLMNDYDQTCLGSFDGGEERIYEIEITAPGQANIILDPLGTAYTGMVLDSVCPASGGSGDCMAVSTSIPAETHSIDIFLESGTYYLMVDTWPQPSCIPDYDIYMYFEALMCGDVNDDSKVNVSDAVYIINYVFAGGEPPYIYSNGDVNCDGTVNVSDAVWIINYVFTSGNNPCDINGDKIRDC